MNTKYSELELKFRADEISFDEFEEYLIKTYPQGPQKVLETEGWDTYYRQGDNVVRFRYGDESTLTVKQRTSNESILNRVEVDLSVDRLHTDAASVHTFMQVAGFKPDVAIWKTMKIYWINYSGVELSYVIYDVASGSGRDPWLHPPQPHQKMNRYIEVEVEKSHNVTIQQATKILKKLKKEMIEGLNLPEPLNLSLYEIYSNHTYKVSDAT